MTVALVLLGAFSLVLLKGSLDITAPRRWTMLQTMTDAYMGYEQAYAERISFDIINGTSADNETSPWQVNGAPPQLADIGTLPGGVPLTGTVIRRLTADPANIPADGAPQAEIDAALVANPTEVESWILESHLVYQIGSNSYHKSRTVVRSR